MTNPNFSKLVDSPSRGSGRIYTHPQTQVEYPSVTTYLSALSKPFLSAWSAKLTAEAAVEMVESGKLQALVDDDPTAAVDLLKKVHKSRSAAAANRGTRAHGAFEARLLGKPIGSLPDDVQAMLDQFQDFLDIVQPTVVGLETTCWHDHFVYAGTADAILKIDGATVLMDYKTGKSVYPETRLQLAAYRMSEYRTDAAGVVQPMPNIDRGAVLHISEYGWKLIDLGDDCTNDFQAFVSLIHAYNWNKTARIPKPILTGGC